MAKKDKENTTVELSGNDDKPGKKEKKEKNKSEKKQPGKVAKWFKDLKIEFKKVVWPSKKTVTNNTAVVLAVVVASAVLVGLLDTGFLNLLRLIYQQG
ncbi:MAG: preprotein translocase subunit SecE [Ruminococcus sp.]|nr:preprotein translocase subunit SecE [Ruminococcus sp.]